MFRSSLPVFVAALFIASPAVAATYVGQVTGIITGGSASFFQGDPSGGPGTDILIDLVGKPITISFSAAVVLNYYDPAIGQTNPRYVTTDVLVTVSLPDPLSTLPVPSPLGAVGAPQSNDPYNSLSYADYTGDAQSGSFFSTGSLNGYEPDLYQTVQFDFDKTLGSLTGSGSASVEYFLPANLAEERYGVTYDLTGGTVVATGAPEPAGWALLIGGFGAVGAMMRRRPTRISVGAGG